MALNGIKVLELAGLAPVPMCGMILSDFGATVTRVDKVSAHNSFDVLHHGKRKIALNLKCPKGQSIFRDLARISDVLIEPFRPGVMEKLRLGPDVLMKDNSRLIYARLTGYGQSGPLASAAGHDINYMAISGLLSLFGRKNENPTPPINFAADFAGGGLLCAFGICIALLERHRTNKGQIVDLSMTEGAAYVGSWLTRSQTQKFIWPGERGANILDSGSHFYNTYKTKDGKFMAVGAVEPQFYSILVNKLNLEHLAQFENYEENTLIFAETFLEKTQEEWCAVFDGTDACVTPVVDWRIAHKHEHNKARASFADLGIPNPAPKLSKSAAKSSVRKLDKTEFEYTVEVLQEIGYSITDIIKLYDEGTILLDYRPKL